MTVRATRLLELTDRLRAAAETTVPDLAAALGVSARTVRRDLAALRDRGLPITAQGGPAGGVRLEGARGVSAVHLGIEEVVALWLAVRLARAVATVPWSGRAEGALVKLLASLPAARARALRDLCARILVGPPASERTRAGLGPVAPELLRLYEEAVHAGVALDFGYRDRDGRATARTVEPHGLAIMPPVWYLLGRDTATMLPRMFRMDRMDRPALRRSRRFRPDDGVVRALLTDEVAWEPLSMRPPRVRHG